MKKRILCALLAELCLLLSCGRLAGENNSENRGTAVGQEQKEAEIPVAQEITKALSSAAVGDILRCLHRSFDR